MGNQKNEKITEKTHQQKRVDEADYMNVDKENRYRRSPSPQKCNFYYFYFL